MAEDSSDGNSDGGNVGELSPASKDSGNTSTVVGAPPPTESEYWPALSESVRAPSKFVPADSLKSLSLGPPNTPSQGTSEGLEKLTFSISNPNPTQSPSNAGFTRQNSINRGGGNSGRNSKAGYSKPANGSLSQSSSSSTPASPSSVGETSMDHSRKTSGQRNDQHPFRRSHSGPLFRGDNRGNTRDQDRRKKDWGPTRSFNSRESHHPPQQTVGYRPPFIHGAPPVGPFAPFQPPSVGFQPFTTQMVYPGVHAPLYYVHGYHPEFQRPNVPMVAVHPMPVPVPDLDISTRVLKQIEYYFSVENLVKDFYLREQMDRQGGWVQLKLVARFNKVKELTDNIDLILEALQTSNVVEMQGDKLRRKGDWDRWILRSKST